jgi:hypothetical protein
VLSLKRQQARRVVSFEKLYAAIFELFAISESTTRSMFAIVSIVALYTVFVSCASYTTRHPRPWSRIPSNFPSKIIWESFVSTSGVGSSIKLAT